MKTEYPIIINIIEKVDSLKKQDFNIVFCWIPGNMGLAGNEQADKAAKEALQLEMTECKISASDIKPLLNLYIYNKWQMECNKCKNIKLYKVNPILNQGLNCYYFVNRYNQVVYTRCWIG